VKGATPTKSGARKPVTAESGGSKATVESRYWRALDASYDDVFCRLYAGLGLHASWASLPARRCYDRQTMLQLFAASASRALPADESQRSLCQNLAVRCSTPSSRVS